MKMSRLISLSVFCLVLVAFSAFFLLYVKKDMPENTPYNTANIFEVNPNARFEPVLPNVPIKLPRDFAFHPQFQNEKWQYFVHLLDDKGEKYSVHWTYERISRDEDLLGGWKSSQLFIAQVVVTHNQRVWKQQRLARGGLGQAGLRNRPFRLWIDNWTWASQNINPLPGVLTVVTDEFSFSLKSLPMSPYVLEGTDGYQQEYDLLPIASYRFHVPIVYVSGELAINGKRSQVSGNASLTKSWHSDLPIEAARKQIQFDIQLNDGRHLKLKQNKIESLPTYTYGIVVNEEGSQSVISNDDIAIKPIAYSTLENGKQLPLEWSISIAKMDINFTVKPSKLEMWHAFIQPYWLGAVQISGNVAGEGSLKLTGY